MACPTGKWACHLKGEVEWFLADFWILQAAQSTDLDQPLRKFFLVLKVNPQKTVSALLKCEGSGSCLEILWLEPLFELFLTLSTVGLEQ